MISDEWVAQRGGGAIENQKANGKSEKPPFREYLLTQSPEGGGWNLPPSPPWGRGWTAAGVFISRGGTGEGV